MRRPKLLDLFCCQGGAAMGYHRAGFDVVGVDIESQPRYPFPFYQADALALLSNLIGGGSFGTGVSSRRYTLDDFDAIHASPPCQAYTEAQRLRGNVHPELIQQTRSLLNNGRSPWVIENVVGAPLMEPVLLCGAVFGMRNYRHRLFETNWPLSQQPHPEHVARTAKMGRPALDGEFLHVVGNFSGVDLARDVMGMPWASREGLREAVPPVYTEWVGQQLIAYLAERGRSVVA